MSLDEMFSFYNKDVDQVNEYLIKKGWSFSKSSEYGEETVWTYEPTGSGAQAWITLSIQILSTSDTTVKIDEYLNFKFVYSTKNRVYYNKILTRIKELGLKRHGSSASDSSIETYYKSKNYDVVISISTSNNNNLYLFVVKREDKYFRKK